MTQETMQTHWDASYLFGANAAYLEALYEDYLSAPETLSGPWKACFDALPEAGGGKEALHSHVRDYFAQLTQRATGPVAPASSSTALWRQHQIAALINAYRSYGHHLAQLDPLGLAERLAVPALELSYYGFTDHDLETVFPIPDFCEMQQASLGALLEKLRAVYCGTVGIEYMHITDTKERDWLKARLETPKRYSPSAEEQQTLLMELIHAHTMEDVLQKRYVGQKRFSLEGGDSLIPLLNAMIQRAGTQGVRECVIGMAHRGRLNVMINVLGQSFQWLLDEFDGQHVDQDNSGDVKYHLGFSSDVETPGGPVHLSLAFNPSHLEAVSPVVEGSVRARQRARGMNH